MKRCFFFLGKGGVGKTTLSASLSYFLVQEGHSVFWASIDPAHNIYDLLHLPAAQGPQQIEPGLWVEEVEVEAYLKEFLADTQKKAQGLYRYLQVLNLDGMFEVIKHTPALEEYGCLYALKSVIRKSQDKDFLIIDTPPTGLMLRILSLPSVTQFWLKQLLNWRLEILKRRQMVAHIKKDAFSPDIGLSPDDDRVFQELQSQQRDMQFFERLFKDNVQTNMFLVVNPERLALLEGRRIVETLKSLQIEVRLVLLNKCQKDVLPKEADYFKKFPKAIIPPLDEDIDKTQLLKLASKWVSYVYP